jgi:hypothetical protein
VALVLIALWIRNGMAESQEFGLALLGLKLLRFGHTVTDPQRNQDQRHAEQEG